MLFDDVDEAQDAGLNAAGVVALPEARGEVVTDYLAGESVRQHALESVADFDAHLAIVRRDQDQHAIVLLRLPDAPFLEQAIGILLDGRAVQRCDGRDGDLGRRLLFQLIEGAIERFFGRGVDHTGKIGNAAGRLREASGRRPEK